LQASFREPTRFIACNAGSYISQRTYLDMIPMCPAAREETRVFGWHGLVTQLAVVYQFGKYWQGRAARRVRSEWLGLR